MKVLEIFSTSRLHATSPLSPSPAKSLAVGPNCAVTAGVPDRGSNRCFPVRRRTFPVPNHFSPVPNDLFPGRSRYFPVPNGCFPVRRHLFPVPNGYFPVRSRYFDAPNEWVCTQNRSIFAPFRQNEPFSPKNPLPAPQSRRAAGKAGSPLPAGSSFEAVPRFRPQAGHYMARKASVAERRDDNSPAFQCRVKSPRITSPAGTTEQLPHRTRRPC